jgi:hypothetical protein
VILLEPKAPRFALLFIAALVLVAILFFNLTIQLRAEWLECWFGPGLIHRRIRLGDVRHACPVRNRWWYGWGIRLTPHGWMWNASGLSAVELTFANGRKFRLGTDEPDKLADAVLSALAIASGGGRG